MELVGPLLLPFPETNFQPIPAKVPGLGVDAVGAFFAGGGAVQFVRDYAAAGLRDKFPLVGSGFLTEGTLAAQGSAADGVRTALQRRVAAFPVRDGGAYRARFGAPYYGIHRADLQKVLSAAHGTDKLHLGHRLASIEERGDEMLLTFTNGTAVAADFVVGADGVRSVVRDFVAGPESTLYSGTSAFRGIVPSALLTSLPDPEAIQFWMGPNAHVLHYAIGPGAEAVNFFAVVEGPAAWARGERWTDATRPGEHLDAFAGWAPAIVEMLGALPQTQRWGLFTTKPQCRWWRGRAALIGDAAHAMLPHHGQGANTTIEDAVTLAVLLAERGAWRALPATLQRLQKLRALRTRTIQRSSAATNTLLHLPDGAGLAARDARMDRFPQAFAWIHGFDAGSAVEVAREAAA